MIPLATPSLDSELIAESRARPDAFAGLFDRYSGMLYRYVSRRLGPEVAEDLVGETFLVAFRRRDRYDLARPDARPWLFGIVSNLVARHHRTEAARYRALTRSPVDGVAESPAERVAEGVSATAVRPLLASALALLSKGDRDVLLLIAWADLSYDEVAQALGIPVGTVRSRLNRARRKVREALGDTHPLRDEE
ncbi:RNA polymerase sigma factor [Microtetraspora sp. NBRC 13810]|uniref:RNA polymerase sigma factor n=1 Tax=Microtetraspora sp. NBRC 13810 TaxID=3030990 RepID=UPI00255357F1|nr:RNA polymerase sigma factor [Microtetraspora sp. NBRC 13810]